ncbi:TVP38/TMEM64 family protein [Haloarchaeobius sp. DFWS5]|uniref:TVP38/TMEM64 family protein n=1 Tax=Haloarchaeobius sp. DFWS5 TaxID=3446114 RepID=UPI003EBA74F7
MAADEPPDVTALRFLSDDVDRRQVAVGLLLAALLLAGGSVVTGRYLWFLRDPDEIQRFVAGFGVLGPVVFVALQAAQVIVAPIPGQVLAFAAGYLFGAGWGFVYSMTGAMVGTSLALWLSRRYGRPVAERLVAAPALERFDAFVGQYGLVGIFVVFLLPGFPDDVVCFAAGVSELDLRRVLAVSMLGRAPGYLVLALSGAGLAENRLVEGVGLLLAACTVGLVLFWRRDVLLQWLSRRKTR